MLLRWEDVSTSIPNRRQKRLTGVACRFSFSRPVAARCVGLQNCRALDRVRDAHCDWRQLRRRRAGGERDFEQTVGLRLTEGNHRDDALPAAPPWSTIPLPGKLLNINRHACESPSCRARTSRSREVACDVGEPRQMQKGPVASDVLTV